MNVVRETLTSHYCNDVKVFTILTGVAESPHRIRLARQLRMRWSGPLLSHWDMSFTIRAGRHGAVDRGRVIGVIRKEIILLGTRTSCTIMSAV